MIDATLLIARQTDPFNAGPPVDQLCQSEVTPVDLFFVRNHGAVPVVDPAAYRLTVDGLVTHPFTVTLDELRTRYTSVTQTTTLECAGNRRQELNAVEPIPGELGWGNEAISNAVWRGVRLRDVLSEAGLSDAHAEWHVAFEGLDETERGGTRFNFGGSIPLTKAQSPEILLAYEMNGEPLTPLHGYPLRVVVPGYIGARSVKWLRRITVQVAPSENYFQARAYKLFPPHIRPDNVDWNAGEMLGEVPVNSAIGAPADGDHLPAGRVRVQGYAIAGGERTVTQVEISLDGGQSWRTAEFTGPAQVGTWRLWYADVILPPGSYEIVVRAEDSLGHTQPQDARDVWNFKGYVNNAWHRVQVTAA